MLKKKLFSFRLLGTEDWRKILAVGVVCVIFYAKHIHFLAFIHFEYGYNMKVNIGVGMYSIILPIKI